MSESSSIPSQTADQHQRRRKAVLDLLSSGPPRSYSEIRKVAGSHANIRSLIEDGSIQRLQLGLYGLPERDAAWDSLASFSLRYPAAVVCLASAAGFHGLTSQNPHEIWAAFPYEQSLPRNGELACRGFRWRQPAMTAGVEVFDAGNGPVRMTNPARTVVDFLRTMNRTGETEAAMEALGNFKGRMADVIRIARELGAEKAVAPYATAAQGLGRGR